MSNEILSREDCITKIGQIRTTASDLANLIHQVAVSTLVHARDHGDTSLVVSLLNACPQRSGIRAEALAAWFREMSTKDLKVARDGEGWVATCKGRDAANFKVDEAWETSPFMLTKEKAVGKTMELEAFLKWIRNKATDTDTNEDGSPKVSPAVQQLAASILSSVGKMN